jgi:menaquinone-dependent protoporphyrinogen oxidase
MKTLIVYGSYTGVTEDCAKELKGLLKGEVELFNIKNHVKVDLNNFDTIIVGTSIRAGTLNKKVTNICIENKNILTKKTLGVFTCGLSDDNEALTAVEKGLGEELKGHAKVISHFGGEVRTDKLNFFFNFILKKITASQGKKVTDFKVNDNKIKEFANKISK